MGMGTEPATKIKLNIAIMGHPLRTKHIYEYMMPRLPADTKVFIDTMLQGVWFNARRCHNSYEPDATHMLVLQDDLLLCKDFERSVISIVRSLPDKIISLYSSTKDAVKVVEQNKHWMIRNAISGQAIVMPVTTEKKWQLWEARNIPERSDKLGDDFRLSLYIHYVEKYCWLPVPTIVQHIGNRSSTLGYNHPGKYSKTFIGEDKSGATVPWTRGLANPHKLTYTYTRQEFEQYGIHQD